MHESLVLAGRWNWLRSNPSFRSELIVFMNCPKCGLSVRLISPHMPLDRCPRCLVRRRQVVEMRVTADLDYQSSARPDSSQARRRVSKERPSSVSTSPGAGPSG
jgi:hypothetical protein